MNRHLVLLVEDNPDDQALTVRVLKKHPFVKEVVVAHDGVEALEYLFGEGPYKGNSTTQMPSIVLLDLNLPRLNGVEVLRRLRADERTKLLPVIVLTTSTESTDRLNCYGNGANSYVRKPVDFEEFTGAAVNLTDYWLRLNEPPPDLRT